MDFDDVKKCSKSGGLTNIMQDTVDGAPKRDVLERWFINNYSPH
jgi:hypothetical protein